MSSAITAVVVSSALSKRSADKAQRASDASTAQQLGIEERRFSQMREDFAPYRETGGRALGMLEQMITGERDISESAGYQFRLGEGYKGLERSQIGRRLSGRAGKEMMRYGQDYASNEYQNEFGRLQTLANYGLSGAGQSATQGSASTARMSNIYGDAGTRNIQMESDRNEINQQTISNLWTAYNT